ncbi:MAG: ABC transporter permease [Bacteroides sp.]|nr:ABC transporter permease [Bacteroides sp.]
MKYWRQFIEVYVREFKLVFSDQGILLFLLFLPLGYPVIYSLIYNPELVREVRMVVVDHDRSQKSRELVRNLDACQEINVIGYAADMGEGKEAMHSHECFGILEIPEGFGRKIGRGEQAPAVIYSDMSLLLRYRGFLVASTNVMTEMGAEMLDENLNRVVPMGGSLMPGDIMPINNVSMGNISNGFDSFVMPGIVVLILQQSIILAIGMAGGAKRERRRLTGYNAVNMEPSVLMTMLGQAGCYMTLMILPSIWLLHYIPLIFSFPMAGNMLEIFCFILPMVLASIMLGFCIQGFVTERENIFIIWVVTSVIFLFLSGLTWPQYAIHGFWRFLSDMVPATWGVQGFIKMNSNGASLTQVSDAYYWEWGLAALYTLLAWGIQKWVVRPAERLVNPA